MSNHNLWFENQQLLDNKIGIVMKNDKWNETNTLIESSHGRKILKLEDFIAVFDRFNKQNYGSSSVNFYVQVKSFASAV